MQILRAELTQHPRGSLSAPVLSQYYLMPPVSLTCTAVNQLPDQVPISTSSASLWSCAGSQSSPTHKQEVISVEPAAGYKDLHCQPRKSPPTRSLKRACLVAALFAGSVAVFVMSDQLFQRSGLADDTRLTEVALRPLVHEPQSETRGGSRGYAIGHRDDGSATATTTITSVTDEGESESEDSTEVSTTQTHHSQQSARTRVSSSSRRGQRGISETPVGSHEISRTSRKSSPTLHVTTSRRGQKTFPHRLRTRKVQHVQPSRGTSFGTRHGKFYAVTRKIQQISMEEAASRTLVSPTPSGDNMTTQAKASSTGEESPELVFS